MCTLLLKLIQNLSFCVHFSPGNQSSLDEPASLISNFGDWVDEDSKTFQTHFNMLFTMYSIPNIIITLFGGMFVSQYGAWRMLIIFSMCLFIGQFIFGKQFHVRACEDIYPVTIIPYVYVPYKYTSRIIPPVHHTACYNYYSCWSSFKVLANYVYREICVRFGWREYVYK